MDYLMIWQIGEKVIERAVALGLLSENSCWSKCDS